jgi:phospholipid/cholesterol/gamma-HCH transport system permease protein
MNLRAYATHLNDRAKGFVYVLQEFFYFAMRSFRSIVHLPKYWSDTLDQMSQSGTESIPIVLVSSIAIGCLITLEVGNQLAHLGGKGLTPRATSLSVIREMGPIVTGLMLSSRVGARYGSELGAMKISEQLDALRAFGTDPIAKLVMPRLVAALVMFLPLTALSIMVGLVGGSVVANNIHHIDPSVYWNAVLSPLVLKDWLVPFLKPPFFAIIISLVCCYNGFNAKGGTVGVGAATIKGIVVSSCFVLIANFYVSKIVLEIF